MRRRRIEHLQKGQRPEPEVYGARTKEHQTLFSEQVWNGVYRKGYSPPFDCFGYRNFTLYLHLESVGTDEHYICFMPQFADYGRGAWCDFPQGLFAALCFEDVDTAGGIDVCFTGPTAGRWFRLRVIEHNTTELLTFTVTARVEFWS